MGNAFLHLGGQVISCGIISPTQCIFKSESVGRAMAFEHQTAQTQQCRAIVSSVVNQMFKAS